MLLTFVVILAAGVGAILSSAAVVAVIALTDRLADRLMGNPDADELRGYLEQLGHNLR